MKIIVRLALVLALAWGGVSAGPAAAADYIIRSTQVFASTHPWNKGLEKFKEVIEKTSNGRIRVEVYPAGQLSGGNIRTMNEQVQIGTLQLLVQSPLGWAGLASKALIFDLPFLMPDNKTGLKVVRSPLAKEILDEALAGLGVTGLDFWENGYRVITHRNKIIRKPDDFKGVKIRIPPNPLFTEIYTSLGATPVAMSTSEIYTALQQGAVDAQENPVSAIYSNKFYEVAPKITMWKYCWDPGMLTINSQFYNDLPPDLRQAVDAAILEAGDLVASLVAKDDAEVLDIFQKNGAEIYYQTPEETQAFIDFLKPIYDKFTPEFGADKIEKLRQLIAETAAQAN